MPTGFAAAHALGFQRISGTDRGEAGPVDDHRPRFVRRLCGCSAVSHAIRRRVFPTLEFNHWYSNVLSRCAFGGVRELHGILWEACALGIGGVGACCKKPVMLWLSAGFRGMKPVMPWLAHAHCGEEALPPLRDKTLPASVVCISTGIIFSLLASNGLKCAFFAVLGEFCTGCGHAYRVRGEFCTGEGTLRGWCVMVCGKKFSLLG